MSKKLEDRNLMVVLMKLQVAISVTAVLFGIAFPFYIGGKYGNQNQPLYDRFGAVIGEANYVLLAIGIGLFAIAMGTLGAAFAFRTLKRLKQR